VNVILLQDIENLGFLGDKIKVKDGFARNYLFPRNMAMEATAGAVRVLEQKKQQKERLEVKLKGEAGKLADKIKNVSLTIAAESGEEDKLFGSITTEMIKDALKSEGFDVDKKKIELAEPIKKLGVYNVDVRLHSDVKAQIRVWVIKK
jgi:large subunit ribosomal protein L9